MRTRIGASGGSICLPVPPVKPADISTLRNHDLPEVLIAHARICYAQKKYEEAALLGAPSNATPTVKDPRTSYAARSSPLAVTKRPRRLQSELLKPTPSTTIPTSPLRMYWNGWDGRKKAEQVRERMSKVFHPQLELVPEDVRGRASYWLAANLAQALETLKKALAVGYGLRNWAPKDSDCLHDDPG